MRNKALGEGGSLSLEHHQLEIGRLALAVGARKETVPLSSLLVALLWKGSIGADGRGRENGLGKGFLLTSMKNRAALEVGWLLM